MQQARLFLLFLLTAHILTGGSAQPLPCDGRLFLTATAEGGDSRLFTVVQEGVADEVRLTPIGNANSGARLNGLGFRASDGYLYAVHPTEYHLYRLGATGRAERLHTLDLPDGEVYEAGDVTPDGRYLVLLGARGVPLRSTSLVRIDLADPAFGVEVHPLQVDGQEGAIFCGDIAFDPATGRLFGFNGFRRQIVLIDPISGRVDARSFPGIASNSRQVGALYFDLAGYLYGYGRSRSEEPDEEFIYLNRQAGSAGGLSPGPPVRQTDGCSCPYTAGLQLGIRPLRARACTDRTLTLRVINRSGMVLPKLQVRDTLPPGFRVGAIRYRPARSSVEISGDGRILELRDLALPPGADSLVVQLVTTQEATGTHFQRAFLEGLPPHLGARQVSDDPATLMPGDATLVVVQPVDTTTTRRQYFLTRCNDDPLLLQPAATGSGYRWTNGSTEGNITIHQAGEYSVTVTEGCRQSVETFLVEQRRLSVELPLLPLTDAGTPITLRPHIQGEGPLTYVWTAHPDGEWSCRDCPEPTLRLRQSSHIMLAVTDSRGCRVETSLQVAVAVNTSVYAPNAFSPNDDGINDVFFLQSAYPLTINFLRIFDRWGNQRFQRQNGWTNSPTDGWSGDGCDPGLYLFQAEVIGPGNSPILMHGSVWLAR